MSIYSTLYMQCMHEIQEYAKVFRNVLQETLRIAPSKNYQEPENDLQVRFISASRIQIQIAVVHWKCKADGCLQVYSTKSASHHRLHLTCRRDQLFTLWHPGMWMDGERPIRIVVLPNRSTTSQDQLFLQLTTEYPPHTKNNQNINYSSVNSAETSNIK